MLLTQDDIDLSIRNNQGHTALDLATDPDLFIDFQTTRPSVAGRLASLRDKTRVLTQSFYNIRLIAATNKGDIEEVERLLDAGSDVNACIKYGLTPLQTAVLRRREELCTLFLEHGADIDHKNEQGDTALHLAITRGLVSICQLLVDHGGDIFATNNDGQTPLDMTKLRQDTTPEQTALRRGHLETYVFLQPTYDTRLIAAVQNGNIDEVKKLLDAGADANVKDKNGKSALSYARQSGSAQLSELFKQKECPSCWLEGDFEPLIGCGHILSICVDCVKDKILLALGEKNPDLSLLNCSTQGCEHLMDEEDIRLFTGDEANVTRYSELMLDLLLARNKNLRRCPSPDCKMVYLLRKNQKPCSFTCPECKEEYCCDCCLPHAEDIACSKAIAKNEEEIRSKEIIAKTSKPCPLCHAPISKNEGCSHMTCYACKHKFCWFHLCPDPNHLHGNCIDPVERAERLAKLEQELEEYNHLPQVQREELNAFSTRDTRTQRSTTLQAPSYTRTIFEPSTFLASLHISNLYVRDIWKGSSFPSFRSRFVAVAPFHCSPLNSAPTKRTLSVADETKLFKV